jgi:hypothetical protein
MGSYSYLRINDLQIYSTKSEVDPTVMMLFTEKDKRVLPMPSVGGLNVDDCDYETQGYEAVEYATTLAIAKDRLEFMGFTEATIRRDFQKGVEETLAKLEKRHEDPIWERNELLRSSLLREEEVLRNLSFDEWIVDFRYILTHEIKPNLDYWHGESETPEMSERMRYMLGRHDDTLFGFPTYDTRLFIRAVAEITDLTAELVYDVTDLVNGGYVEGDENLSEYARWQLSETFATDHKVVVLTEGRSDCRALRSALDLLYPHLKDYYSFMDFKSARVEGGAGSLASTVKAFIGAGIVNRIIAFFDNDTAAQVAMRSLRNVGIPKNIRVLRYPDIELGRDYPTMGPQGMTHMNVNGLAAGLELYFGRDVLQDAEGCFTPIQWRGYNETLNQYQGEILRKAELQSRFDEKIKSCQADPRLINSLDWSGMQLILSALRSAFHST